MPKPTLSPSKPSYTLLNTKPPKPQTPTLCIQISLARFENRGGLSRLGLSSFGVPGLFKIKPGEGVLYRLKAAEAAAF